ATVKTNASDLVTGAQTALAFRGATSGVAAGTTGFAVGWKTTQNIAGTSTAVAGLTEAMYPSNLYADLSTVTATTINALRLAFQTQKLLERDARGGTRYQETVMAHFGVMPPDYRVQKPEYLGGGKTPVNITPVPQTSGTGGTGTTAP